MQVIVRTCKSKKDDSEKGYGNVEMLKRVELPIDVLIKIRKWAKEYQIALLTKKYVKPELTFVDSQKQDWVIAMNRLFKELQQNGLNSEDHRDAISFLFTSNRDNPEMIDLEVASKFFEDLVV